MGASQVGDGAPSAEPGAPASGDFDLLGSRLWRKRIVAEEHSGEGLSLQLAELMRLGTGRHNQH